MQTLHSTFFYFCSKCKMVIFSTKRKNGLDVLEILEIIREINNSRVLLLNDRTILSNSPLLKTDL